MLEVLTLDHLKVERQVDYFIRLSPIIRPDVLIAGLDEDFYPEESSETSVPLAIPSIIRKIFNYEVPYVNCSGCATLADIIATAWKISVKPWGIHFPIMRNLSFLILKCLSLAAKKGKGRQLTIRIRQKGTVKVHLLRRKVSRNPRASS